MASSRKSKNADRSIDRRRASAADSGLALRMASGFRRLFRRGERLLLGFSGGVDSMVLLDLLARHSKRVGLELAAVHVNHQISPNASRWAAFCRRECRARGVPIKVVKVAVGRGNSIEAAARAARYAVFRSTPADWVVLAHNQDDQCETLLLNLLRGAGVRGLAAMPLERVDQTGMRIARPLLDVARSDIEVYARDRRLEWVEDESNADPYYLRNFLRRDVLPVIAARVPSYRNTMARAAAHLGEAAGLLDDLAAIDAQDLSGGGVLPVTALLKLSDARARNLLRHFLACRGVAMPEADHLAEALRQARTAAGDANLTIDLGTHELRRFGAALHVVRKRAAAPAGFSEHWQGERRLALPALGGVLLMDPVRGEGIALAKLRTAPVTVRRRQGGERLQPDPLRPRRTLKNLFQALAVPPWQRQRLPLLWCGEDLVWVPGLGVDSQYKASGSEAGLVPQWQEEV